MTSVHVWFGYLLLGLMGLKLRAVWWLLRHSFPRRFGRRRLLVEKVAAWSLPVIYGMIVVTGVMMDQRLGAARSHDAVPGSAPLVQRGRPARHRVAPDPVPASRAADRMARRSALGAAKTLALSGLARRLSRLARRRGRSSTG